MTVIKTIMAAVDFSENSIGAARYAAKLAQDLSVDLLLTNIYNQRDVDLMNQVVLRVPDFDVKKHLDEHLKERKERLSVFAQELTNSSLEVKTSIRVGVPYEALLEEIDKRQPDMLVMGVKGRSNMMDMIIGSCAQKMFRRCPIPLLTVRTDES
jgi:nucleotide-binding universal stress UspA family protein